MTPPEQGVTPTTGLDVVTMIHNLRNEVRDLREYGIGGSTYGVVEENSSPFTAQILALRAPPQADHSLAKEEEQLLLPTEPQQLMLIICSSTL